MKKFLNLALIVFVFISLATVSFASPEKKGKEHKVKDINNISKEMNLGELQNNDVVICNGCNDKQYRVIKDDTRFMLEKISDGTQIDLNKDGKTGGKI
ncbi:MAG: hypothetical protein HQK49_02020 [Oligoflexia bacterium]|nr:hypothetical protein [Oligoflexia bacterium]